MLISDPETVFAAVFILFSSPRPSVRNSGICLWTVSWPAQHPGHQSAAGGAETAPQQPAQVCLCLGWTVRHGATLSGAGGSEVLQSLRGPDPPRSPHRPTHVSLINYPHLVHDVML